LIAPNNLRPVRSTREAILLAQDIANALVAPAPVIARLARDVVTDPETGCVVWQGSLDANGYGRIVVMCPEARRKVTWRAHRLAYEIAHGPIPQGLVIDHLCRNRRCCNAAHLEVVTSRENVLRGIGPSAMNARKDACDNGHPFVGENLYVWKGHRGCRACRRAAVSESARRKREAAGPAPRQTHCVNGHPLSGDNLYVHNGKRYCRTCCRRRSNAYKASRRAA
jgi:hypothetical protein